MVALQTSAYFTTYFPPEMRFQFNGHNIVVYGKKEEEYLISDPVFEHTVSMKEHDLQLARFARGFGAPRGMMHYPVSVPATVDLERVVRRAIRSTWRMMLYAPGIFGLSQLSEEHTKSRTTYPWKAASRSA